MIKTIGENKRDAKTFNFALLRKSIECLYKSQLKIEIVKKGSIICVLKLRL